MVAIRHLPWSPFCILDNRKYVPWLANVAFWLHWSIVGILHSSSVSVNWLSCSSPMLVWGVVNFSFVLENPLFQCSVNCLGRRWMIKWTSPADNPYRPRFPLHPTRCRCRNYRDLRCEQTILMCPHQEVFKACVISCHGQLIPVSQLDGCVEWVPTRCVLLAAEGCGDDIIYTAAMCKFLVFTRLLTLCILQEGRSRDRWLLKGLIPRYLHRDRWLLLILLQKGRKQVDSRLVIVSVLGFWLCARYYSIQKERWG